MPIDGDIDAHPWQWAEPLRDMESGEEPLNPSYSSLLWSDEYLYVAFDLADPNREAVATEPGSHVYRHDTAAEIFVGGPGGYFEFGVNSIGTSYQLAWYWVEPMVANQDVRGIDGLFRLPNFLYYLPQRGERLGRVGDLDFQLPGLIHAEKWADRRGQPGWTVEIAIPWRGLGPVLGIGETPSAGDVVEVQAYMSRPTHGFTWSVQGNSNVHNVERWVSVELSSESVL